MSIKPVQVSGYDWNSMFEELPVWKPCELNFQHNKGPLTIDNTNEVLIKPVIKAIFFFKHICTSKQFNNNMGNKLFIIYPYQTSCIFKLILNCFECILTI